MMQKGAKGNRDPGRSGRDPDGILPWKVVIFSIGAALGISGMAIDSRSLVGIGSGVLFAGVFLRFLPRLRPGRNTHSEAHEDPPSLEDEPSSNPGTPDS
jgi:hypothetical protein